jgi:hypothetical protein
VHHPGGVDVLGDGRLEMRGVSVGVSGWCGVAWVGGLAEVGVVVGLGGVVGSIPSK